MRKEEQGGKNEISYKMIRYCDFFHTSKKLKKILTLQKEEQNVLSYNTFKYIMWPFSCQLNVSYCFYRGRGFELLKILWKQNELLRKIKESGLFHMHVVMIFPIPNCLLQKWYFVYCSMMESRIADQEEVKRARERIRQRIADDRVCCFLSPPHNT